jgi:hypothetical protein
MNDMSKLENARAAREARDSVASSPGGSTAAAVAAAMRRYLGAEQYHELRSEEEQAENQPESADHHK